MKKKSALYLFHFLITKRINKNTVGSTGLRSNMIREVELFKPK